jgi:parallel beta-helix repeat protein
VSRSGKRRRRRVVGAGVALLGMTLLGAAAGHLVARVPAEPGSYGLREVPGGERLELLGGRIDLPALAEALARDGRTDILTRQDGTWLLSRSLVIRPGATLEVRKATLRLHSEPNRFVGLEARGGNLEIVDSTVTSWAPGTGRPDDQVDDGRAWVLAREGAVMNVLGSRMEQLGYARAERSGVAWRTKATSGTIHRSTFAGNWYGAWVSGTRNLRIEDNVFRHNGRHGLTLAVGCSNATVRGNQSYANAGHGMVVFQGSNDVTLTTNEVHDNRRSGIDVDSSLRLRLTGNVVYGNDIGLHVHGRSRSIVADDNRLAANRLDGLRISSGATQVTASKNLIDFNHRAGVFIAEGTAEIGPANRLLDNEMGVWLSTDARGTAVMDNSIESNVLDGVHLAGLRVGLVRGNLIRANRKAAFSVASKGSARPFLTENRLVGNPAQERVRVEGHPQPAG